MGKDESAVVSAKVKAAKQRKNGYRLALRKHLDKFDDQNTDKVSDEELLLSIEKAQSWLAKLEQLDSEILTETDDADIPTLVDESVNFSQDAEDRIHRAKVIIASRNQQQPSMSHNTSGNGPSQGSGAQTVKLPTLNIQKYDGDPLYWREFWDSFRSTIHSHPSLSPVEKFKYLKHYLTGEAAVLVDGYDLSDQTYKEVVDVLKERFGDEELAIFAHIDSLLTLPKASNNLQDVQRVLDKCESHIRSLKSLGVDEETSSRYNVPIILSKLPSDIRTDVYRRNGAQKWTVASLRKHLREELTARRMGKQSLGEKNGTGKSNSAYYSSRRHRRQSSSVSEDYGSSDCETTMLASSKRSKGKTTASGNNNAPQFPCFYCRESHFPDQCDKYPDLQSRLALVKDNCLLCLNRTHKADECWYKQRACYHCKATGEHHRSLCPQLFGGGKSKTETCYLATESKATDRKFLPTACVMAKGEKNSAKVQLLLDQCSERSFGKIQILEQLGARLICYESAATAGIQSERVRTETYPIYQLQIFDQKRKAISITVSGVKSVSAPLHRPALTVSDVPSPPDVRLNESVYGENRLIDLDLLIGLDQYYSLVGHGQISLVPGLFLLNTRLGYVLTGCLKDSSAAPRTEAVFLATEVLGIRNPAHVENLQHWLRAVGSVTSKDRLEKTDSVIRGGSFRSTTLPRNLPNHHVPIRPHLKVFEKWNAEQVADWLRELGLSVYAVECKHNIHSGIHLLNLPTCDYERMLGIRDVIHVNNLQDCLRAVEGTANGESTIEMDTFMRGGMRSTVHGLAPSQQGPFHFVSIRPPLAVFEKWDGNHVADWLGELGLSMYEAECKLNIHSGRQLLDLTISDFERMLGIRDVIHVNNLQDCLRAVEGTANGESTIEMDTFMRGGMRSTVHGLAPSQQGPFHFVSIRPPLAVFEKWDGNHVADWLGELGLSMYEAECKLNIHSGRQLLDLTISDFERRIELHNGLHLKKLQLFLRAIERGRDEKAANMDYPMILRWLEDLGLTQYRKFFANARIDGLVLDNLTMNEVVVHLHVSSAVHVLSLSRGLEALRQNGFNTEHMQRRYYPALQRQNVYLWTQHCVAEWLKSIDLGEYAPNLRFAGVHGALMCSEPSFTAESLVEVLRIPSWKTTQRRLLTASFNRLLGSDGVDQKQAYLDSPFVQPVTPDTVIKTLRKYDGGLNTSRRRSSSARDQVIVDPDELLCSKQNARKQNANRIADSLQQLPSSYI